MNRMPFSYSVLRYIHDAASEEFLNVGVVVLVPSIGYAKARIQREYARLSGTFEGFYGDYYRKIARHVETQINALSEKWVSELGFDNRPADAKMVANVILPDDDSSLQFSEARSGVTDDPDATLEDLFVRMVIRNQPRQQDEARSPEDVWKVFRAPLVQHDVLPKLHPVEIAGSSFGYTFDHAYKNDKWHPLEPLSMDAVHPETLRERAVKWVGRATDLQGDIRLGKLYMLIGAPQREMLKSSYGKAIDLLHKMPIDHELIKEDEAEDFAESFSRLVRQHEPER